jgi:hypothetical protein
MPTLSWLQQEFTYGYDSGDILSLIPRGVRRSEEERSGGSYRRVFKKALQPHLRSDAKVFELGPGKGSWSRAILRHIAQGELHTVDFQAIVFRITALMGFLTGISMCFGRSECCATTHRRRS